MSFSKLNGKADLAKARNQERCGNVYFPLAMEEERKGGGGVRKKNEGRGI